MVVTIDCRDTINCKVTIVLCNGAHIRALLHKTMVTLQLMVSLQSMHGNYHSNTAP